MSEDLFFFLEGWAVSSIWTEKAIDLSGNFEVIFRAHFGAPQIILSSYAHAFETLR